MQKEDSKGQARTEADSELNDQNLSVSQHSEKPPVVGSPLLNESQSIAFEKCFHIVNGLTYKEAEKILYELLFALKKVATIAA